MELYNYRSKILSCDYKILRILEQRYNCVLKVANYKGKNRKPILDRKREEEVKEAFINNMRHTYFKKYHEDEFRNIINLVTEVSRDIQYKKIYKKNIVLIGFMGCGKTTVGRVLSKRIGSKFLDTDYQIEKRVMCKVGDIFEKMGEEYFRKVESEVIKVASKEFHGVISTGGGSVLNKVNVKNLKSTGKLIYLKSSAENILYNLRRSTKVRPMLKQNLNIGYIQKFIKSRHEIYNRVKDYEINVDDLSIDQIIYSIIKLM